MIKMAYILLFLFQKQFHDKTPYTIMFGPDKCGLDNKVSDGRSVYYIYISLYLYY